MTTAAQGDHVYREPNPMDPWDDIKRWLAQLWPAERVTVVVCAALVAAALTWLMLMWISR